MPAQIHDRANAAFANEVIEPLRRHLRRAIHAARLHFMYVVPGGDAKYPRGHDQGQTEKRSITRRAQRPAPWPQPDKERKRWFRRSTQQAHGAASCQKSEICERSNTAERSLRFFRFLYLFL